MKNSFPTLDQIKKVVKVVVKDAVQDEGKTIIAAFDRDVKLIEARVNNLEEKVDKGFTEINQRLDTNDDTHQQILGDIEEIAEKKIKKHYEEQHPFATL